MVSTAMKSNGSCSLSMMLFQTPQHLYTISQNLGNVTLNGSLDYETERFYQLEIMAYVRCHLNIHSPQKTVKDAILRPESRYLYRLRKFGLLRHCSAVFVLCYRMITASIQRQIWL